MKASKQEFLKHVIKQLKMAYSVNNEIYISIYCNDLDNIINNNLKF